MNFGNLYFVFLATFYFIIRVKADWSEDRGVIVNQLFVPRSYPYEFPKDVRYYSHNGQYEFINFNDNTTRTYYLCPYDAKFGKKYETCVFPHDLPKNESEPRCNGQTVEAQLRSTEKKCGESDNPGYLFEVSYRICKYKKKNVLKSEKFLMVYEICYSEHHQNQLLYSRFSIPNTALLGNYLLLKNEADIMTTFQDDHPTIWNGCQFNLQPVLPPRLMAFVVARRAFLHHYNLAYMRSDLIDSWNILIKTIKNKLMNAKPSVEVYAGIYGELTNVGERIIPQIWWITIYDRRLQKGTTVILPNGYYKDIASIQCKADDTITCTDVNLEVPHGMYCCKANYIATLTGIPIRVSKNFEFKKDEILKEITNG